MNDGLTVVRLLMVLFLLPHPQAFQALLFTQLVFAARVVLHQERGRLARALLAA
jgi:hypothetical protein